MKTKFISKEYLYDGSQLRPLYAYQDYGVLGPSIVSWVGPCQVHNDLMIDLEDFRQGSQICGDLMVHFVIEIFEKELFSGVALQRIFASIAKDFIEEKTGLSLIRSGDDLYFQKRKLSISIASKSPVSTMIHFAVNVVQEGTPVPTACLKKDFKIQPAFFAKEMMSRFSDEYESIVQATQKVHPL